MIALKYTEHAFYRMTERDINRAMVEAVVMSGSVMVEITGVCRYTLEGLVVVVDGQDVVTAYYDSDCRQVGQWNPKKKQRKGQQKRTAPASTWIGQRGRKINIKLSERYAREAVI